MGIPVIEVRGLSVCYRTRKTSKSAVEKLSFRVYQGEIAGFVGPNGAGKTSAMKAILDLIPVSPGTCFIEGIPSTNPQARKKVGYMPEIAYYPKYLTLRELLQTCAAVSGVPRRERKAAVAKAAGRVGMTAHLDQRLSAFSKGMLQQAGFAQALVHDPQILILDEPMSGLDPIARMRMRWLLSELRDEGKTILFSSHELSEIEMVSNRILLLNRGRLIFEGSVDEVVGETGGLEKAFLKLLGEELPWAA